MSIINTNDCAIEYMTHLGQQAKRSARDIARADSATKNKALRILARLLSEQKSALHQANAMDLAHAQALGLDNAFIDRLTLSESALQNMIDGVLQIADLADPIGEISQLKMRPSGIQIGQMRVPLGVIGMIYEARPNVTVDAAALCLKSGNAVILRGGSEAINSNTALANLVKQSLVAVNLPEHAVQVVDRTDRDVVTAMISMPQYIDVIVPRGGKSLVATLMAHSRVPMIKHLDGICHTYIDSYAHIEQAITICDNAKTQRYAPCNTMETLLVAHDIATHVLPQLARLYQQKQVELRCCPTTHAILSAEGLTHLVEATESDWSTEYLAPILSIKTVQDMDEAIAHINQYGSHHTDAIVTENYSHALRFLREVDSASVMVNASTRFADGFEYGLGAEIGISNDKLHARGPVGLDGLTSLKYVVLGTGQIRS